VKRKKVSQNFCDSKIKASARHMALGAHAVPPMAVGYNILLNYSREVRW
jgi:hypothetical protein